MVPLTFKLFSRCLIFAGDGGVNGVPGERGTFYPHGKLAHPRHHPQFLNIIREFVRHHALFLTGAKFVE